MRRKTTKKLKLKEINSKKPGFKVGKIIKFEKDFDPTKIPFNVRWQVRDFTFLMDMGKKRRKK